MKIKTAARKTGSALIAGLCIIADAQNAVRIAEIDSEMEKLQTERDHLSSRLINR